MGITFQFPFYGRILGLKVGMELDAFLLRRDDDVKQTVTV